MYPDPAKSPAENYKNLQLYRNIILSNTGTVIHDTSDRTKFTSLKYAIAGFSILVPSFFGYAFIQTFRVRRGNDAVKKIGYAGVLGLISFMGLLQSASQFEKHE